MEVWERPKFETERDLQLTSYNEAPKDYHTQNTQVKYFPCLRSAVSAELCTFITSAAAADKLLSAQTKETGLFLAKSFVLNPEFRDYR